MSPMELSIECNKRDTSVNPRALRRGGQIPAVLYGHDGDASISLTVDQRDAEKLVKQASENNTLINVNVPDIHCGVFQVWPMLVLRDNSGSYSVLLLELSPKHLHRPVASLPSVVVTVMRKSKS